MTTRSIAARLGLMFGLAATVVLAILAVSLFLFQSYELQRHKREELSARLVIIERLSHQASDLKHWAYFRDKLADFTPEDGSLYFAVESADPRFRVGERFLDQATFDEHGEGFGNAILPNGQRYLTVAHVLPPEGDRPAVRLMVAAGQRDIESAEWLLAVGIVVLSLVAIAAVSATGWWIARRGLAPVDRLSEYARRLDARDLTLRLPADDLPTELDGLVVSLNEALARLQRAYEQLNAFNADVAHELRTPLGNMIGETQVTLSRARSTEALVSTLQSNLEELERLRNIINSMLFLARADRGETARDLVEVSLHEATTKSAEFMEMLMEDAGLELRIVGDARACVEQSLYARAITNLLDNALRHGAAGSTVHVDIADGPDAVSVTVRNQATLIPPDKLAHLFDRFYRADPSRTGSDQNHGLGLAIVKAVAQLHGGSVFAESRQGEVAIGLRLPRVPRTDPPSRPDRPAARAARDSALPSAQPSH